MRISFDSRSLADYERFLQVRQCPIYHFRGEIAEVPDEHAARLGLKEQPSRQYRYSPIDGLFDYQRDIVRVALQKQKYAIFADCGLGKTMMFLEFARNVAKRTGGKVLIVSPLMVCKQTVDEAATWYGNKLDIGRIRAFDLQHWLNSEPNGFDSQIAVTNYEAIREGLKPGT